MDMPTSLVGNGVIGGSAPMGRTALRSEPSFGHMAGCHDHVQLLITGEKISYTGKKMFGVAPVTNMCLYGALRFFGKQDVIHREHNVVLCPDNQAVRLVFHPVFLSDRKTSNKTKKQAL
ncbi:hypothetical protein [Galbibacter sp. PAP.153]|uniref:hypothetical protein n=1 Tax=Galbibacter sp. PAP.153 TaxID=3104623 RepID=UPI003008C4CA